MATNKQTPITDPAEGVLVDVGQPWQWRPYG